MARIRTIKPELPQSESLGRVTRDARLLFVNLFTIADDAGRMRGQSRLLASLLYPFDDGESAAKTTGAQIEGWLGELEREGCIICYEVGGTEYIQISKWLDHQKIDRPSPSRIPECTAKAREESRVPDALPRTVDHGPRINPPIAPRGGVVFEAFWEAYPEKTGKKAALKAWEKAKDKPDLDTILAALDRYKRTKPADRSWKNPATWLNQGCWLDAPAALVVSNAPTVNPEEAQWSARISSWQKSRFWIAGQWGPPPDQPGCKAPKRLLAEHLPASAAG